MAKKGPVDYGLRHRIVVCGDQPRLSTLLDPPVQVERRAAHGGMVEADHFGLAVVLLRALDAPVENDLLLPLE